MRTQYGGFGITEIQFIVIITDLAPMFYKDLLTFKMFGLLISEVVTYVLLIVYFY